MARTYVALDLETTGLSPRLDRMIEAGAVRFRDGEVLDTFQSFVRPEVGIPRAVQELTGIKGRSEPPGRSSVSTLEERAKRLGKPLPPRPGHAPPH